MVDLGLVGGIILAVYTPIGITVSIFHVYVLRKMKPKLYVIDIPLFNLTIMNTIFHIVGLPCMIIILLQPYIGILSAELCIFVTYGALAVASNWSFGFLLIAFERFISVVCPLSYRILDRRKIWIACFFTYVCGGIASFSMGYIDTETKFCRPSKKGTVIVSGIVIITCCITVYLFVKLSIIARSRIAPVRTASVNVAHLRRAKLMLILFVVSSSAFLPLILISILHRLFFPMYSHEQVKSLPLAIGGCCLLSTFIVHYIKDIKFRSEVKSVISKLCNKKDSQDNQFVHKVPRPFIISGTQVTFKRQKRVMSP